MSGVPPSERGRLDLDHLRLIFARSGQVPHVRESAVRLVRLLDTDRWSGTEIEGTIASDPALTLRVLRAAAKAIYGQPNDGSLTIRRAVMQLGHRAVRTIALGMSVHGFVCPSRVQGFTPEGFARHSLFVGLLASSIWDQFAPKYPECPWSPDEVLAAGILHDLPLAMLLQADPYGFEWIWERAMGRPSSLYHTFRETTGTDLRELGAIAIRTWGLPEIYADACVGMSLDHVTHPAYAAVHALILADYLSKALGTDPIDPVLGDPPTGIDQLFPLRSEDLTPHVRAAQSQSRSYLPAA